MELASTPILHHKDRGVRAVAACCLVDLLRLYAPNPPFEQESDMEVQADIDALLYIHIYIYICSMFYSLLIFIHSIIISL